MYAVDSLRTKTINDMTNEEIEKHLESNCKYEARKVLSKWMENFNEDGYEDLM